MSMHIPPERAFELSSAMGSKAARVAATVQRCVDVVDASLSELENRVTAKLRHPKQDTTSVSQEAAEIRAYVAHLKPTERVEFIRQAALRKELSVVAAVVNFSPWVSGLTPDQADLARSFARDSLAPRESKQADALRKIKASLDAGAFHFGTGYNKLVPKVQVNAREQALQKLKGAA